MAARSIHGPALPGGPPFLATWPHVSLTLEELLAQFRGLLTAYRVAHDPVHLGEGNLRCEQCLDCNRCRFCVRCVRCDDCGNCEQCEDCVRCTRTKGARRCVSCNDVELSDSCEDSQYLLLCLACVRCEQCFACVGLQGESYCVLNKRYSRKDYFQVTQALKKRLEEQIGALMPELAMAAQGVWPRVLGELGGGFVVEAGRVRGVVEGEPVAEEVADESPWAEGVVPLRVDAPRVDVVEGGGKISRVGEASRS